MRAYFGDNGDGVSDNAGSPSTLKRTWLDINWMFPANAPNPSYFEVAIYLGNDPANTSTYVTPLQRALGTDRRLVIPITPLTTLPTINASVRPVYE